MPTPDESDPSPKKFTLKARAFEAVNPPAGSPPDAGRIDVHDLFRSAQATPKPPGAMVAPAHPAPPKPENEVQALLRANVAREVVPDLPPPTRRSRRRRDYFITLIGGNIVIVTSVALAGINVISLLFGLGGVVMFSLSVTWIIWFVMDDY